MRKHIIGGLALVLGAVVMPMTAHAVTVNCTAGKKIADALAQGATDIRVVGTCNENVEIRRDDVSIEGVNNSATVIGSLFINGVNRITIKKLIVQGAATPADAGILIDHGGTAVLDNVTVHGMITGVVANGSSFVEIRSGSRFENNVADGVTIQLGSSAVVKDSFFINNSTANDGDAGISSFRGGSIELVNNIIEQDGTATFAVFVAENSYAALTNNTVTHTGSDGGQGLFVARGSSVRLRGGNTITATSTFAAMVLRNSSTVFQGFGHDTINGFISLRQLTSVEVRNAEVNGDVDITDHSAMWLNSGNATVNGSVFINRTSDLSFQGPASVTGDVLCSDVLSRFYGQAEGTFNATDCSEN